MRVRNPLGKPCKTRNTSSAHILYTNKTMADNTEIRRQALDLALDLQAAGQIDSDAIALIKTCSSSTLYKIAAHLINNF